MTGNEPRRTLSHGGAGSAAATSGLSDRSLAFLHALVSRRASIEIGVDRRTLWGSRLNPVTRRFGLGDIDELVSRLQSGDRDLEQAVIDAMNKCVVLSLYTDGQGPRRDEFGEMRDTPLAGVGALFGPVHILGRDTESGRTSGGLNCDSEARRHRGDRNLDARDISQTSAERGDDLARRLRVVVQFPVSTNERRARHVLLRGRW